ncbi:MAG TPA: bifunctional 5,10-methylene-tetrahydrofolate dehydrogenase/5,10-methylene-tetrahydrofolate cyclohydrolase [Saprospirales bacterium]|nr:bifunctional 5,10-methylene-tetrahydrofolate dehydrogenase/5,10-methylene-tetrahydrofolate cyclohydrolase [Saprospirales bacterium]HAY71814.1 bifunctional 5,10-methylene-tetrahydrofolate dehydrogenase/5,10-methylene-tetrahydrofolate cyclohydrolase [Saprospirales bacterium]HRQ29280.1 bifunctional 5,10-methylenetetrahydrofolate dehydrogenase/5,10-methenyltetrahydrofolate cyclohydrolase [Saprospiraceae bacterium]
MQLLDGKLLSANIKKEIKIEVENALNKGLRRPKLAAVLVGHDPASQSYVRSKIKSCEQTGFDSDLISLDEDVTQEDLLQIIHRLNTDTLLDGYIVQLPLPAHINDEEIIRAVDPAKDVDGFHPFNMGKLSLGLETFIPATPYGILLMLERYNIKTKGKIAVVLGRSNIVGTPMALLLSRKAAYGNCTVIHTHSATIGLTNICKSADILIAAIGVPEFVKADMVKPGAIVIDVGINRVEDVNAKNGYRLVGDVDFEKVAPKCSFISPVPGGVGLMTVAALLLNTMKSYKQKHHF